MPLAWAWLRGRGEAARLAAAGAAGLAVFSGLVLFGIQLIAARQPVRPTFISHLDVRMHRELWNRLPPNAMVFDPDPRRAVTVLGRPSDAMHFWTPRPDWAALVADPDPYALRVAGYTHLYFDLDYWEGLSPLRRERFETSACVQTVNEGHGVRSLDDQRRDFRRLLEITACQAR